MPTAELRVTDHGSRTQGSGVVTNSIPASRYADVAQVPKFPDRSTVRAVEICGAETGEYEVEISDKNDETYRLTVEVENESLSSWVHSRGHGVRRYKFSFRPDPAKGVMNLMWIDRHGKPRSYLDGNDW